MNKLSGWELINKAEKDTAKRSMTIKEAYEFIKIQQLTLPYKGKNVFDAGFFYCPYVPLQMIKSRNNLQPKIGFRTRYLTIANPFKVTP